MRGWVRREKKDLANISYCKVVQCYTMYKCNCKLLKWIRTPAGTVKTKKQHDYATPNQFPHAWLTLSQKWFWHRGFYEQKNLHSPESFIRHPHIRSPGCWPVKKLLDFKIAWEIVCISFVQRFKKCHGEQVKIKMEMYSGLMIVPVPQC